MVRPARPPDPAAHEALLRAAAESFARDGYAAASLNRILEQAGWAKSSFYHYFQDKQQLHDHVVEHLRSLLGTGVELPDLAAVDGTELWAALQRLLEQLAAAARRHPETRYLGLMYHHDASASPDGALARLRADVETWISEAVRVGTERGVIRTDIPVDLATELTIQLVGVLDRWAVDHALHSPGGPQAAQLSLTLIRDLTGAPAPGGRGTVAGR